MPTPRSAMRRTSRQSAAGAPALPGPEPVEKGAALKTRRLLLASEALGVTAEIDILEVEDGACTPVDVKAGRRPHVAEGAYLPERVQLCVQGLLLREAGYRSDDGAIWYAASRERVRVVFDEALVAETLRAASDLRLAARARRIPPPLQNSPKCPRCSLLPICLPDEVNWFRRGQVPRTLPPPARPALPLYVQTPGARVTKRAETLVVQVEGEDDRVVPLDEVSDLALAGPVSLTTPAIHELLHRDIPVVWMSSGFWFLGSTGREGPRSAAARTAQYGAAADPVRRLAFARSLVGAKVRNQRTILRRNWRGDAAAREAVMDRLAHLARKAEAAADMPSLLGIEGEAASLYFRAVPALFSEAVAALPAFSFENRNRRPPLDPVNACLSLAYALLTRTMSMALVSVGLDPWKGLYHVERPGRPSLALDLMEPFRPILADSAVLTALNNGELAPDDFVGSAAGCNLTPAARRRLIAAYERRLDQPTTHPTFGYRVEMRRLVLVQARLLARHLMGDVALYPHYVPR